MSTLGTLKIIIVAPTTNPPTSSSVVITPNPLNIEPGKSANVTVKLQQPDGTLIDAPLALVPFWGTASNHGISATVLSKNTIKIDVPTSAPVGATVDLQVDVR